MSLIWEFSGKFREFRGKMLAQFLPGRDSLKITQQITKMLWYFHKFQFCSRSKSSKSPFFDRQHIGNIEFNNLLPNWTSVRFLGLGIAAKIVSRYVSRYASNIAIRIAIFYCWLSYSLNVCILTKLRTSTYYMEFYHIYYDWIWTSEKNILALLKLLEKLDMPSVFIQIQNYR